MLKKMLQQLPMVVLITVMVVFALFDMAVQAEAATFTVKDNSAVNEARHDTDLSDDICDTDSDAEGEQCTLRAAIENANTKAGPDTINFNISGAGVHTISPKSPLPTIEQPVAIDGYTQPGSRPNSLEDGNDAILLIQLNGSDTTSGNGLTITGGESKIRGLVINSFKLSGIRLEMGEGNLIGKGNVISGNFIGTDSTGTQRLDNQLHGIEMFSSAHNIIGGTELKDRNIISGNVGWGVAIFNVESTGNNVQGNFIGTDKTGTQKLGNEIGVIIVSSPENTVIRNIISGNLDGVAIANSESIKNKVQGNFIGTDVTGTQRLGNSDKGVLITFMIGRTDIASDNIIGGTTIAERNIISDNGLVESALSNNLSGIYILGDRNEVKGNFIGTDVTGTIDLGNANNGVVIHQGSMNKIGAPIDGPDGARQIISGNGNAGIQIFGGSTGIPNAEGNEIKGNFIGTDVTGNEGLGNSSAGIFMTSIAGGGTVFKNNIGGIEPGEGNVISANILDGVAFAGAGTSENIVQGNFIGTDVTGTKDLGNLRIGILISGNPTKQTIGGSVAKAGNVISGNDRDGIQIVSGAKNNNIWGNYIGTKANGTDPLGNTRHGVSIFDAQDNVIGGINAGERNIISNSGGVGVSVNGLSSKGNAIRGNNINTNTGLGIDLGGDGVTLNDIDGTDSDTGPNDLMNTPLSVTADFDGTNTTITGILKSTAPSPFIIDIYANEKIDASGFGEGQSYLGSAHLDIQGNFELVISGKLPFPHLSATATDGDGKGSTSEFSPAKTPLIFIPGVMASTLVDTEALIFKEIWLGFAVGVLTDHGRLSLFSADNPKEVIATDVFRESIHPEGRVYKLFLEKITTNGYREYLVDNDPLRRSTNCDYDNQKTLPPSLFLFAYDWRKNIADTAGLLKEYVACVHKFYPGAKIDVLTHSMGGVVARRYIIDNTVNDVQRLITIAAPWLGASKMPFALETGDLDIPKQALLIKKETVKDILGSFTAAHQLIPSQAYHAIGGGPVYVEDGWDLNSNGTYYDEYSYDEMTMIIDKLYGFDKNREKIFNPGTAGKNFHTSAQDNWGNEASGIKYHHLYGWQQDKDTTIGKIRVAYGLACYDAGVGTVPACIPKPVFKKVTTEGDGTVPLLSLERRGNGFDLNAPNAVLWPFTGPDDDLVSHNELPNNLLVQNTVMQLLADGAPSTSLALKSQTTAIRLAAVSAVERSPFSMTLNGAQDVVVNDALGNTTEQIENSDLSRNVPGITLFHEGNNLISMTIRGGNEYTVSFRTTNEPLSIELTSEAGASEAQAIRYIDLTLPTGRDAELKFTATEVDILRYDSDGDGSLDASVSPTLQVSGPEAEDIEAPKITVETTAQDTNTLVTLVTQDNNSGVKDVFYSLDGRHFKPYTAPFTVNPAETPVLYAFANDNVLNRGTLVYGISGPISPDSADLAVDTTSIVEGPDADLKITYTIRVSNIGPVMASSVVLADNLPANVSFVSCSSTGTGVCAGSGNNRTITFPSLVPGALETITIVVSTSTDRKDDVVIENRVTVDADTPDSNDFNNTSVDNITLEKTPNNPPVSNAGSDQSVESTGPIGTTISLNGTGSSDPDGDALTYLWTAPGITFDDPVSSTPFATFPLGTTTVTLTVTDPDGLSSTDTVLITITTIVGDLQTKLVASDGVANDQLGFSVSMNSNTAVMGAPLDDDKGTDSGSAYVFVRDVLGAWTQQAKLLAGDGAASDNFGQSVSVNGNTAVVGAWGDDDKGNQSGSAYVFVRDASGVWTQQAKLTAADGAVNDQFGFSVSVNGDTAIVGSYLDDDKGTDSGSVYVFNRVGTTWTQQAKLIAIDGTFFDFFGRSLSINGNTAVVGAHGDDDKGVESGSAYVFTRSGTTWTQQAKLIAIDGTFLDRFGQSVSVNGDTTMVGAPGDGGNSGSAYVFTRIGNIWIQQAKLNACEIGEIFGISVSLDGNKALVGAIVSKNKGASSGSAYVFSRFGTTWTQQAKLLASDGTTNDRLGISVSLDGNRALAGAYLDDDKGIDSGSAYVYILQSNQPPTVSADDASVPEGSSVALSGSGSDPEAGILTYAWDLDNDGIFETSGQNPTFSAEGRDGPSSPKVVVKVNDDKNVCAKSDVIVTITNENPIINLVTSGPVNEDSSATITVDATDPAGSYEFCDEDGNCFFVDNDPLSYEFDCDNNSEYEVGPQDWNFASCTFVDNGSFPVNVRVSDDDGGEVTGSATVVIDKSLVANAGPDQTVNNTSPAGAAVSLDGTGSSNANGDTLTFLWTAPGITFNNPTSSTPTATFPIGATTVTLSVTDPGGSSDSDTVVITVVDINRPPVANAGPDQSVESTGSTGTLISLNGTGSSDPDGDSLTYYWSTPGYIFENQASSTLSAIFFSGTTTVTLRVTDPSGKSSTDTVQVALFTTTLSQQAKLLATDGVVNDLFGWSVSVNGDTAVVGAFLDDDKGAGSGSAYVFVKDASGDWTQQAKLLASDGLADDQFGSSVSVDGDTAVVGANWGIGQRGSAYVFTRIGTTWNQQAKLISSDPANGDEFGSSVSVDGDTAVVGVSGDGSAYIFTRTGTTWSEQARLTPSGPAGLFGVSVSVDGDTAVVGAYLDDVNGQNDGSAYVFTRTGSIWSEQQKLTVSDDIGHGEDNRFLGESVSVNGDTVVLGAPGFFLKEGAAYVFTRNGTTWTQQQKLTASDGKLGNFFGHSVSFNGETAVVGAYEDDRVGAGDSGSAYVFTRTGTIWTQKVKFIASDGVADEHSGFSVSVHGDTVVVGAPGFFATDGAVSVFTGSAYVYLLQSNQPPTANAGQDQTVESTSPAGANVSLDGSSSSDPDVDTLTYFWAAPGITFDNPASSTPSATFPLGATTVTLTVTDESGASSTDTVVITVQDTTPPTLTVSANPSTLWSPNHEYVPIVITAEANDLSDTSLEITAKAHSSELDDASDNGDGKTTGDIKVIKSNGEIVLSSNATPEISFDPIKDKLELRSERAGNGSDRTYTIMITVTDDSGNQTTRELIVTVPHDQGG